MRFAVWPLSEAVAVGRSVGRTLSQRLEGSDGELEMTRRGRRGAREYRARFSGLRELQ